MPGYEITADPTRFDIEAIHAFLSNAYWSRGIPRTTLARAIANSACVGVLHDGAQVGFARAITDQATFAYLADVYVLEAHRGKGLANRMVRHLLQRTELQGLRRVMLATRDAHRLYAKHGFKTLTAPERLMEIHNPDAYANA